MHGEGLDYDWLDLDGMVALRTGATLAYALPNVRLRIHCSERVLVEVRRPPLPDRDAGRHLVASCAFRRAVASAHERFSAGEQLSFLGLPAGCSPLVEVGLAPSDQTLPGDIYRVAMGADWLHVFASTLPVARCKEAAGPVRGVGFHRDLATDVTLVHRASPAGDLIAAHAAHDTLLDVLGRCLTTELVETVLATG